MTSNDDIAQLKARVEKLTAENATWTPRKTAGAWRLEVIHCLCTTVEAMMAGQPSFFDLSDRYEALSAAGDPLERLAAVVDFEVFRGRLVAALRRGVRGKGGRPPFDPVLMFKILVLQALYSLSDEATEFQIKDRLSFQRFLGLGLDGTVPDATTVWLFRERLVKAKAIDGLFARFDAALTERGYLAMGGQIIDATVVPAPRQRNTEAEKMAIKEGRVPEDWKLAKVRQKDRDARWSVKYTKAKVKEGADPKAAKPVDLAIPMFGYKNHIGIDRAHGLIRTWDASAANAHDGARLPEVVSKDNTGSGVWADTAYRSKKNEAFLAKGMFTSHIHQKKPPRRPMPERIARANAKRSAVRSAVEHVFAGQKHRMGLVVRTIGIARARIKIGMANLAYNFQRLAWLEGRTAPA
jgi:IS5 family transposase